VLWEKLRDNRRAKRFDDTTSQAANETRGYEGIVTVCFRGLYISYKKYSHGDENSVPFADKSTQRESVDVLSAMSINPSISLGDLQCDNDG
jgi:hypothetical protein